MNTITIRELLPAELPGAGALLGRGMRDNPLHVSVVGPDPARREVVFGAILGGLLASLHRKGTILGAHLDGRLVGVCALVPPGHGQPGLAENLALVRLVFAQTSLGVTLKALRWLGTWARHEHQEPHWHLGPVGVERDLQGRGIGGALLREFCARVDAQGGVAYLETDKDVNVTFYEKFGFKTEARADVVHAPGRGSLNRPGRD